LIWREQSLQRSWRNLLRKSASAASWNRNAIVRFIESNDLKVGWQGKDYITVIYGEEKNDRFPARRGPYFMKTSDLIAKLKQESNETTEEIKRIERDALSRFESD
jgi:hypothetical protein